MYHFVRSLHCINSFNSRENLLALFELARRNLSSLHSNSNNDGIVTTMIAPLGSSVVPHTNKITNEYNRNSPFGLSSSPSGILLRTREALIVNNICDQSQTQFIISPLQLFLYRFISLQGILYERVGLDNFDSQFNKMCDEIDLITESISDQIIFEIALVCIHTVSHSLSKEVNNLNSSLKTATIKSL